MDVDNVQNILSNIFRPPVAIPELYEHISETCSNYWNEIISTYDPIKNKRLIKSKQNLKTFSILVFITFATVIKNYNSKRDNNIHQVRISKDLTKIGLLFKKEEEKKKISFYSGSIAESACKRTFFTNRSYLIWRLSTPRYPLFSKYS